MIKIENVRTYGWEPALRGMRNPKNSWKRSDSVFDMFPMEREDGWTFVFTEDPSIGQNDYKLATELANAGPEHGKFLRMIHCYADITAPLYWWKEFDTYKVGTVANSCSTMHKIMAKPFEIGDFSHEHLLDFSDACNLMSVLDENISDDESLNLDMDPYRNRGILFSPSGLLEEQIRALNQYRNLYLKVKDAPTKDLGKKNEILKKIWWQVIQLLPSSYNQMRTLDISYWCLRNIYRQRQYHKLDEWRETFCKEFIHQLPYYALITGEEVK